jgi:hypothetical protein
MARLPQRDQHDPAQDDLGQFRGIISGDFGYALPWATQPIGFAVGAEFRKYKAQQLPTAAKTRANWVAPAALLRTSTAAMRFTKVMASSSPDRRGQGVLRKPDLRNRRPLLEV